MISVVVCHYEQPRQLDLVLTALDLQVDADGAPLDLEVVVADDGSAADPDPGRRRVPVYVVGQADEGFRAAAARNLGWRATSGEHVVFLDADTVPEPGFVAAITAVLDGGPCGTLAVGRRRHADLDGWTPQHLRAWFDGTLDGGAAPRELPEPAWLADGYRATDDLRAADDRSYRFVISAVLAAPRRLLERIGGFDGDFVGYGGEDWDLAHRAWLAGADLRHVPDAVAWHDGPDLAGRDTDRLAVKNAETLALAQVLTDPLLRGAGLIWRHPRVVAQVDAAGAIEADVVACVASLLAHGDVGVWVTGAELPAVLAHDPRVHRGAAPADSLARCRHRLHLDRPALVPTLPAEPVVDGALTLTSTRAAARGERPTAGRVPGLRVLDGVALEALWGGWG